MSDDLDLSWEAARHALGAFLDDEFQENGEPGDVAFCEVDPTSRRWSGAIVVVRPDRDSDMVPIGEGLALPRRMTIRRGGTTITVDSSGERPTYEVTIRTSSAALLRRLRLQSLVEQAVAHVTVTTADRPRGPDFGSPELAARLAAAGPLPAGSRVKSPDAAKRFVRAKATRRDVERAADAYRAGGIEEVKRVMFVADRQAWRYVSRAQELDLVERKRAKRRREGES